MPGWAGEFLGQFAGTAAQGDRSQALESGHTSLGRHITKRSRALLLLIDLYGFEPWGDAAWVAKTRTEALREIAQAIPSLRPEDLGSVATEYKSVLRELSRKSIPWTRLLLIGGGGLALGALTLGLAAPIIGAAVGSATLGLSGAAATSAGLASLGGGSLAAGGFGMTGGTALLVGVGGVAGAGTAAAGGRWTGWTAGQVVAEAVKLEVVTRLVLIDAEGDDEKARKVVEGLNERIRGLAEQVLQAAELVKTQRDQIAEMRRTNEAQASEIKRLRNENKQTQERLRELKTARSTLEVIAERIETAL